MKKSLYIIVLVLTCLFSCRQDPDAYEYYGEVKKMAYNNYTDQFHYIWKNICTGYVFWDIDTTDWDAVYERYTPVFEAMDAQVAMGKTIPDSVLSAAYTNAMGHLKDHHMKILVQNLHPASTDETDYIAISPGTNDYIQRPEKVEKSMATLKSKLTAYQKGSLVSDFNSAHIGEVQFTEVDSATFDVPDFANGVTYVSGIFKYADGRKVPYLWQTQACMTPVMEHLGEKNTNIGHAATILDKFFTAIATLPKDSIAGFILDNRGNYGGYQDDLDYLIGSFINEKVSMGQTRYKEGPGRLEYSQWVDYMQAPFAKYHRDIVNENIPYVFLTNMTSISMGEMEPLIARSVLPVTHVIGERSFGATGPLQPDQYSLTYGGIFGSLSAEGTPVGHYIYTSHFQLRCNGRVWEGTGVIPDEEIIRKDNNNSFRVQIDSAINYCKSYK